MAADGSVVINTKINTSGFEQATVNMKSSFENLSVKAKQLGQAIKNAFLLGGKTKGTVKDQSEEILQILSNTEKDAKSKAASIAAIYRKQGLSQEEAFKKAWQQIDRDSSNGSNKVKKHLKGIGKESKNVGLELQSNLSSGIFSAVKKIGSVIGGFYIGRKLIDFGKESIELGSDLEEAQNVVDSVFTTMSDKVNDFAKNAAVSAGLSETMAKQYAGAFGAMSKSFGFAENDAYEMSTALTQLAGDVASFYNISQDEAYTKLKSVFTGETESLKDLGVVMTQNALDAYAMANGYGKTTSAMTEQEKVALRYRFVMEQLSTASGDFLRTSDGWANQVRVMKLQIDSLKATIGQGLINIFTPVIKVINTLLAKLATVANAFKSFTELITGKKSSGATSAAASGLTETALADTGNAYNDAASGAENLAGATEDVADATKQAEKEQKKYLSGLDEIRTFDVESISDTSPGTGTAAGADGGLAGAIGNVDYGSLAKGENVLEKTSTLLDTITKKFKQLAKIFKKGFWDGLGDYKPILDELKKDIDSIRKSLKEIFTTSDVISAANNFAETLLYSIGQTTGAFLRVGLTIAQNIIGGIESSLSQGKERIKQYLVSMFDISSEIVKLSGNFNAAFAELFSLFGSETAQKITGNVIAIFSEVGMLVSETAAKLTRDISGIILTPFIENKEKIKEAILGTLEVIQTFTEGLMTFVQNIRDQINEFYETYLKPFFDSIKNGISGILSTLLDAYNTYILPVLQSLTENLSEFLNGPFSELVKSVLDFLGSVISALQTIWEEVLVPLIEWIIKNIIPVVMPIIEKIGKIVLDLVKTITKAASGIIKTMSGLIDFVVDVFTGDWEGAYNDLIKIGEGFYEAVKEIFDFLQRNIFSPFSEFMSGIFEKDWTESFGVLGTVLNNFFDNLELIWNSITGIFQGVIDFVAGIFTSDWDTAWNGVKNIFKNVFEGLVGLVKAPINEAIRIINNAISTINGAIGGIESAISFDVGFTNPFTGRQYRFGLDMRNRLPRVGYIPYLAKGAVIPPNAPFTAVLGDQKHGTNIEAPLETIKQAVRDVVGESSGSGGTYMFTAQINRRTLFEEMITEAEIVKSQTGFNPFEMA